MYKKTSIYTLLPSQLIDDVEKAQNGSQSKRDHAIRLVSCMQTQSMRKNGNMDSFLEIPKNYFRKKFNSRYLEFLKPLIAQKIILVDNYYNNIKHISKAYKINSKYYSINNNSPKMWLHQGEVPVKSTSYNVKKEKLSEEEIEVKNTVLEDLKKAFINYKKVDVLKKEYLDNLTINSFILNDSIDKEKFNVIFRKGRSEKKYWMTKEAALAKAKSMGMNLIQDKDHVYIMPDNEFLEMKRQSKNIAYTDSINRLKKGILYARRNKTNNRLDTNYTNLPGFITKEIFRQNDYVQFDLANSQFAILSHTLDGKLKTEDFNKFKTEAYKGELYECIQDELNIDKRIEAKKCMFELMFSSEDNNTKRKEMLKKLFPTVVDYVDAYKKDKGYKNFSISLQQKEAEIFIDGIWKEVKREGLLCITKHDAVICRREDMDRVREIIQEHFEIINFKGKIIEEIFA